MGMEFEEIILGIEKEFKLRITDEEAEKIYQLDLGGLLEFLLTKVYGKIVIPGVCLSSHVFYKMRRTMVESLGMSRNSISPRNDLVDLFPESIRRCQWERLSSECGLQIPPLESPEGTEQKVHNTSCAMFLLGLISIIPLHNFIIVPVGFIIGSFYNYYVNEPKMMEDKTIQFPEKITTLRDLIMMMTDMNFAKFTDEFQAFTEIETKVPGSGSIKEMKRFTSADVERTWERLLGVIIDATGFDREYLERDITMKEVCY